MSMAQADGQPFKASVMWRQYCIPGEVEAHAWMVYSWCWLWENVTPRGPLTRSVSERRGGNDVAGKKGDVVFKKTACRGLCAGWMLEAHTQNDRRDP